MVVDWPEPAKLLTNRSLLNWLEAGSEAATSGGMALGDYELHAHPDLVDRLVECTKDAQVELVAAFGIPCVATSGGVIIAFARGTNTMFVRGVSVASPVRLEGLDREWEGVERSSHPSGRRCRLTKGVCTKRRTNERCCFTFSNCSSGPRLLLSTARVLAISPRCPDLAVSSEFRKIRRRPRPSNDWGRCVRGHRRPTEPSVAELRTV